MCKTHFLYLQICVVQLEALWHTVREPPQSLFSSCFSRFIWTNFTHACRICLLLTVLVSCFFKNSATECCQLAAHNRGIYSENFHAIQTHVQAVNIKIHTWIYKPELRSAVGHTERWESPSCAWTWGSKC